MNPLLKETQHNKLLWLLAFVPTRSDVGFSAGFTSTR